MSEVTLLQTINQLRTTIDWLSKTVLEKIREQEVEAIPALLQERQRVLAALIALAVSAEEDRAVVRQYLQERQQRDVEITQALQVLQERIGKSVKNLKCILEYTQL